MKTFSLRSLLVLFLSLNPALIFRPVRRKRWSTNKKVLVRCSLTNHMINSFFPSNPGHVDQDARSAAARFCQTNPSALHQEDPDHLHSHRHFRLLGEKRQRKHWLASNLEDKLCLMNSACHWHQMPRGFKPLWKAHCDCLVECASALTEWNHKQRTLELAQRTEAHACKTDGPAHNRFAILL